MTIDNRFANSENIEEKRSLWRIHPELERLEFANPSRARELLDKFLDEIDTFTGTPDMWHTIAMVAGRVRHYDGRLQIIQAGLREWPDDVDLLCEQLQAYYGRAVNYNPEQAQKTWNVLYSMEKEKVGVYWRFWVYGAIYHARELNDSRRAIELLDEGLLYIRRENLMDIFRSYRRVLVDGVPLKKLSSTSDAEKYQKEVLNTLEEKYKLGITLGVEGGYVLATELAILYQEQAGSTAEETEKTDYLQKALDYLDLAEKLYTGNPNHPIWDIYQVRIHIYMALHKYGDAIRILKSLPEQIISQAQDQSLSTMKNLCAHMTGEKEEMENSREPDLDKAIQTAIPALFENGGELLRRIADQNPAIKSALMNLVK